MSQPHSAKYRIRVGKTPSGKRNAYRVERRTWFGWSLIDWWYSRDRAEENLRDYIDARRPSTEPTRFFDADGTPIHPD